MKCCDNPTEAGTLYTIAAPSGAGKTSLVTALVTSMPELQVSISYTTRPKRPAEEEGIDYFFVSEETFQNMIKEEAFLEHAIVFGNHYGTAKKWVEGQLHTGKDVILEIDWQGGRQVKMKMPQHTQGIFILPPSVETLRQRLEQRGQDGKEVIQQRMAEARREISHYHEYDYVIVNDHFGTALTDLQSIIRTQRLKCKHQQKKNAQLLNELLA